MRLTKMRPRQTTSIREGRRQEREYAKGGRRARRRASAAAPATVIGAAIAVAAMPVTVPASSEPTRREDQSPAESTTPKVSTVETFERR